MVGKSAKNTGIRNSLFGCQLNLSNGQREMFNGISKNEFSPKFFPVVILDF